MPRLIVYQQTHHETIDGVPSPVSILPLISEKTGITHVYIAAIHINTTDGGAPEVKLNDHVPDDQRYDQLWEEVKQLQSNGVVVMGMLGGAAKGTYANLSGDDSSFERYYTLLSTLILHRQLQGLDLDVEEHTSIPTLTRLIQRLKRDFGAAFLITLAPVYAAMFPRHRAFAGLTRRMLNETDYPPADPLTASLCATHAWKTPRNLSGFDYIALERSELGRLVAWYNVQMYCGWAHPGEQDNLYDNLVGVGWKPERVVMGLITAPGHGPGYAVPERITKVVAEARETHGSKFGGVMGWEYWHAGYTEGDGTWKGPWEWVRRLGQAMKLV